MIPKNNRATKKEIDLLFQKGSSVISQNLIFKFLPNKLRAPRISIIVPKTVARLAIKRNFLKRRAYNILKKHLDKFPSVAGAFIFKKYQDDVVILENEIKDVFNKIS